MGSGDPIERRALLAGGASLVSGLAGCSAVLPQSEETTPEVHGPPPLHRISMTNHHDDEIALTIVIERDGTVVYWDSHSVPPANANPDENFLGHSYSFRDEDAMGCGTFEVTVRQQDTDKWATIDFRDLDPERGRQIRPVKLAVEVSPDHVEMDPWAIDKHFDCAENEIVSREESPNGTATPGE